MKKYVKIPRELMESHAYHHLSDGARILFGFLLDLKAKSSSRAWIDTRGYRYVLFTKQAMQEELHCSRYTIDKYTKELEMTGLLRFEYIRTPLCERRIYVRSFDPRSPFVTLCYDNSSHTLVQERIEEGVDNNAVQAGSGKKEDRSSTDGKAAQAEGQAVRRWMPYLPSDCPLTKAQAASLTLKHIRMMTCILEEMIGDLYEEKSER